MLASLQWVTKRFEKYLAAFCIALLTSSSCIPTCGKESYGAIESYLISPAKSESRKITCSLQALCLDRSDVVVVAAAFNCSKKSLSSLHADMYTNTGKSSACNRLLVPTRLLRVVSLCLHLYFGSVLLALRLRQFWIYRFLSLKPHSFKASANVKWTVYLHAVIFVHLCFEKKLHLSVCYGKFCCYLFWLRRVANFVAGIFLCFRLKNQRLVINTNNFI